MYCHNYYATMSFATCYELPAEKLKRLEREYEVAVNDLKECDEERDKLLQDNVRLVKEIAEAREAAKPKKTRGQETEERVRYCCSETIAAAIDAEIANAKAEQREADAIIFAGEKRAYEYARRFDAESIRNQK